MKTGFNPTPEQIARARAGDRVVACTPEQDEYIRQAQEQEDARHAADPGPPALLKRLKELEKRIEAIESRLALQD